jgi:hypothetical protein
MVNSNDDKGEPLPTIFWSHYCPREKDTMFFEKGAECDWCGAKEQAE